MTPEKLIAEGRRLARPCVHLKATGSGEVAGLWHASSGSARTADGQRAWMSFNGAVVPLDRPLEGCITLYSGAPGRSDGRIEITHVPPGLDGTPLFAHAALPLPPLEAVFLHGGEAVGRWLAANEWRRERRYDDRFEDRVIADAYVAQWLHENPRYCAPDVYAVLGGWHDPGADPDWHDLAHERLIARTLRDAEPWVEAWQLREGGFRVIERVT